MIGMIIIFTIVITVTILLVIISIQYNKLRNKYLRLKHDYRILEYISNSNSQDFFDLQAAIVKFIKDFNTKSDNKISFYQNENNNMWEFKLIQDETDNRN